MRTVLKLIEHIYITKLYVPPTPLALNMVPSLTSICAKNIADGVSIPSHLITMLENISYTMHKKHRAKVAELKTLEESLLKVRSEIHLLHTADPKDDILIEYADEAWEYYDETVYLCNESRYRLSEDFRNYCMYSYVASKVMVCPSNGSQGTFTDENYQMFKYSLQRWESLTMPEHTGAESRIVECITEYFQNIKNFIKTYETSEKDTYEKTVKYNTLYNDYVQRILPVKGRVDYLESVVKNLDKILMENYLETSKFVCTACGADITDGEECCDEMELRFEY